MKQIIVVGAGPIGLWTAVQMSILLKKSGINDYKIHVLDKRPTYTRTHSMFVDFDIFDAADLSYQPLRDLIDRLSKNKSVLTTDLEQGLTDVATKLGITIQKPYAFTTIEQLKTDFPEADVVIGADGAHSDVRQNVFKNEFKRNDNLKNIAIVKYQISQGHSLDPVRQYELDKQMPRRFTLEHVGKPDPVTKNRQVTLQIMISTAMYTQLKERAKFSSGFTLAQLEQECPELHQAVDLWMRARRQFAAEVRADDTAKFSVISLDVYQSDSVIKRAGDCVVGLIGDAAHGVPFFRSFNNGIIAANQFAVDLTKHLKERELRLQIKKEEETGYLPPNCSLVGHRINASKVETNPEVLTKQRICALLMVYFRKHHMLHGTHVGVVPNWEQTPVPHLRTITSGLWYKERVIYFDPTSKTIDVVEVGQFYSDVTNRFQQLSQAARFTEECVKEYQQKPAEILENIEQYFATLSGTPLNDYQAFFDGHASKQNFNADLKNSSIGSAQAVIGFNASLPWAFLGLEEGDGPDNELEETSLGMISSKVVNSKYRK